MSEYIFTLIHKLFIAPLYRLRYKYVENSKTIFSYILYIKYSNIGGILMTRLKQLRMEKGVMSQRQLVIALEKYYGKPVCTAATISKIENKPDYNPTLKTLRSISEFF